MFIIVAQQGRHDILICNGELGKSPLIELHVFIDLVSYFVWTRFGWENRGSFENFTISPRSDR